MLEKGTIATLETSCSRIVSLARLDCGISVTDDGPVGGVEIHNHGYAPVVVKIWLKAARLFEGPIHEITLDMLETAVMNSKDPKVEG